MVRGRSRRPDERPPRDELTSCAELRAWFVRRPGWFGAWERERFYCEGDATDGPISACKLAGGHGRGDALDNSGGGSGDPTDGGTDREEY